MKDKQKPSPAAAYAVAVFRYDGRETAGRSVFSVTEAAAPLGYRVLAQTLVAVDDTGTPQFEDLAGRSSLATPLREMDAGPLAELGGPLGLLHWVIAGGPETPAGGAPVDMAQRRGLQLELQRDASAIAFVAEMGAIAELAGRIGPTGATPITLPLVPQLAAALDAQLPAPAESGTGDGTPDAGPTGPTWRPENI